MVLTFDNKSYEYDSAVGLAVYYPFGRVSIANSLGEKFHRYMNLIAVSSSRDSREDTLMDMAVVALLGIIMERNLTD